MKINTGIIGRQRSTPQPSPRLIRSLQQFIMALESRNLAPEVKQEVVNVIKQYPEGSLNFMFSNIDNIIQQCQKSISERDQIPVCEIPQEVQQPKVYQPVTKPIGNPVEQRKALFDDEPKKSDKWETVPASQVVKPEPVPPKFVSQSKDKNNANELTPQQRAEAMQRDLKERGLL